MVEPGPRGAVVLARGVIATGRELALEARLARIYQAVLDLLADQTPAVVALEDLYAEYRFPRTALLMAHARGVIVLAARQRDVAVLTLAPAEVKRAVAANGAASKAQMQRSVQRLLGLAAVPRPTHVADALALAYTGLSRMGGRLA